MPTDVSWLYERATLWSIELYKGWRMTEGVVGDRAPLLAAWPRPQSRPEYRGVVYTGRPGCV
jgi:hypothetical protein